MPELRKEIQRLLQAILVVRERRHQRAVEAGESADTLDLLELEVLGARLDLAREGGTS